MQSNSLIKIVILSPAALVCIISLLIFTFDRQVRTKNFELFALLIAIISLRFLVVITLNSLVSYSNVCELLQIKKMKTSDRFLTDSR